MATLTPDEKSCEHVMDCIARMFVTSSFLKLEKDGDQADGPTLQEGAYAKTFRMAETIKAKHPEAAKPGSEVTWGILRAVFVQALKESLGDLGVTDEPHG